MANKIRIFNPDKVTKSPNPAKTIERQEAKVGNIANPKASRLLNQNTKQVNKDQTITLPKPKIPKGTF